MPASFAAPRLFLLARRSETRLDTLQDVGQVRLGDRVENAPAVAFGVEKAAALHQTQMFRRHGARDVARFRQFTDGEATLQHHLHHPQAMGMGERTKTLRGLPQGIQVGQLEFRVLAHNGIPYSNVSAGHYMTIYSTWRESDTRSWLKNWFLSAVGVAGCLAGLVGTTQAADPPRSEITATFSIVAVDPETGICGAAVASKYPAVGKVVPIAKGNVGAFCTQHYHVPAWREKAIAALEQGSRPDEVLVQLLRDDPQAEQRQLAIVDRFGRAAVHNPTQAPAESRYWGAMTGRFYCCQGNTLAGRQVVTEMAKAYEETRGSVADRLMAALVAADRVGGDHRGRLAAGIRVAKPDVAGYWLELDVDRSDDAVEELLKNYLKLEHAARGEWKP